MPKKQISVVAAVIENDQNELLCALRSPDMSLPNLWEFPGGKVEAGEDLQTAIEREIREELHCNIKAGDVFHRHVHEYDTFIIELICLQAELISGEPVATEHAKLLWLTPDLFSSLNWAPADIPAVEELMAKASLS